MQPIRFVVALEDINDLNMTESERYGVEYRLRCCHMFGTAYHTAIIIFPVVVFNSMKTEERIVRKFNYTVTHEIIHVLLDDISCELGTDEEYAHAFSMLLNDDIESNRSGMGHKLYKRLKGTIEIVVSDTEDEETEEPQIEAQTRKAVLTEAEIVNANRNLSRERLAKFHETIS